MESGRDTDGDRDRDDRETITEKQRNRQPG